MSNPVSPPTVAISRRLYEELKEHLDRQLNESSDPSIRIEAGELLHRMRESDNVKRT